MIETMIVSNHSTRRAAIVSVAIVSAACVFLLASLAATAQERLHVLAPDGGESLEAGSSATIRWSGLSSNFEDSVAVEYSIDDGATWRSVRARVRASELAWGVPAVNSDRCRVRVRQVTGSWHTPDSVQVLGSGQARGSAIRFSEDGTRLLRWGTNGVDLFDVRSGALLRALSFERTIVAGPLLDRINRRIAVGVSMGDSIRIEVWSVASGARELAFYPPRPTPPEYKFYSDAISALAFDNAGGRLVVSSKFSTTIWSIAAGSVADSLGPVEARAALHTQLRFAPGDSLIYAITSDGKMQLWDAGSGALRSTLAGPFGAGAFSPDCREYFSNVAKGGIQEIAVYDLREERTTFSYQHNGRLEGMLTPDTRHLIWRAPGDSVIHVTGMEDRGDRTSLFRFPAKLAAFAANPAGDRIATLMGDDRRIIIWRFDNSDSSDEPFSIRTTAAPLGRIDMGSGIVGRARDTVLTAYIRNTSGAELAIERVSIASGDTADFTLLSGAGPATIPAGGTHPITLRFTPRERGERGAWLEVQGAGGARIGELVGIGRRGVIAPEGGTVSFGPVPIHHPDERAATLFRNVGDAPIRLDSLRLVDPAKSLFTVVSGGAMPREILPGDTLRVRLRFEAPVSGSYNARLVVWDEYGSPSYADLAAVAESQLAAPDEKVVAGDAVGLDGMVVGIAPNPASDRLMISLRLEKPAPLTIRLVDPVGRVLLEEGRGVMEIGAHEVPVDLSAVPAGPCLLVISNDVERTVRLVIVRR